MVLVIIKFMIYIRGDRTIVCFDNLLFYDILYLYQTCSKNERNKEKVLS